MAAQSFDEALFSKFFPCFAERFGDAVSVESKGIAGKELALRNRAIPLLENAENGGGGVETIEGVVAAEEKS